MKTTIDNKIKCGVYKIENIINKKCYIGSTTRTFKERYCNHKTKLKNNKHENEYLQRAYNKYGGNNFEFSILETCSKDNITEREQYYMDKLNSKEKYNILEFAHTVRGFKHTIEEKLKMIRWGNNNGNYTGIYTFYHPEYKYFIGSRCEIIEKMKLKESGVHKICNKQLNKHSGWVCLGRGSIDHGDKIEFIYNKIICKPMMVFYHKDHNIFIGNAYDFRKKFNLKRGGINSIIDGTRQSNCGWIYLGKYHTNFVVPSSITETYNTRLSFSNKTHSLLDKTYTFINTNGNNYIGTLRNFIINYGIEPRGIKRVCKGERKTHIGWYIK